MSEEQLNRQQQLVKEYLDALLTDDQSLYSIEAELEFSDGAPDDRVEAPLVASELPKAGPDIEEIELDDLEITLDMQISYAESVEPEPLSQSAIAHAPQAVYPSMPETSGEPVAEKQTGPVSEAAVELAPEMVYPASMVKSVAEPSSAVVEDLVSGPFPAPDTSVESLVQEGIGSQDAPLPGIAPEATLIEEPEPEPEPEPAMTPEAPLEVDSEPLQCLLVKMYGVKLALPVKFLQGAHDLSSMNLELSAEADWILGSYVESGKLVRVVDTGMWMIPERYEPDKAAYTELVKFRDAGWAVTIDSMIGAQEIEEDLITWNNNPQSRPWLLGTCMKHQCAVVNVPALLHGLNTTLSQ